MLTLSSMLSMIDSQRLMQSSSELLFRPQSGVNFSTVSRYRIPVSRIYLDTGFEAGLVAGLAKAAPISASATAANAKGLLGKATAGIISRQNRSHDHDRYHPFTTFVHNQHRTPFALYSPTRGAILLI